MRCRGAGGGTCQAPAGCPGARECNEGEIYFQMDGQGDHRWVKLHEESLDFHPRFFPVFEEKREN